MSQINLQQHYQEILTAVAVQLVKAKIELADDGNTITLYFGNKYVAIHLKEKWLEVYFCDLKIIEKDSDGEWDKLLLSFTLDSDTTELEATIFVSSVVAAIKTVYYWWVDGGNNLKGESND